MPIKFFKPAVLVSLLMSGCGGADAPDHVLIYIDNGAIQCEFPGNPPQQTAKILADIGITVVSSECGYRTGTFFLAVCDAGDANINLHTIHSQHFATARELGYEPVSGLARDGDKGYEVSECRN